MELRGCEGSKKEETSEQQLQLGWKVNGKFRVHLTFWLNGLLRASIWELRVFMPTPLPMWHQQYCSHSARLISSHLLFKLSELPQCMPAENGANRLKVAGIWEIKGMLGTSQAMQGEDKMRWKVACSQTWIITLKNDGMWWLYTKSSHFPLVISCINSL